MFSGGFSGLKLIGAAKIAGANPPTITWQTGLLDSAGITRNAAGDYTFSLIAQYAVDDAERIVMCFNAKALAASGLTTIGVTSGSADATIRITIAQEAALGAASTLVDTMDFWMIVLARPIR